MPRDGKAGGLWLRPLLHQVPIPTRHGDTVLPLAGLPPGATKMPAISENIHIAELASSRISG